MPATGNFVSYFVGSWKVSASRGCAGEKAGSRFSRYVFLFLHGKSMMSVCF
jgi:hypothetical protein